ncbi:MAG: adenylate/guanylate cyclase domain-containing protein [Saprospiraceae bacterium]
MRTFLTTLLFLASALAIGQTVAELEQQLKEATTSYDQMTLSYQLAGELLKTDPRRSVVFAKAAHQKAVELGNDGMAAESAYLTAKGYNRTHNDRGEDIWLKSAIQFAMQANDADLILKTADQRSRLAVKNGNEQKALKIVREVFDYFSKKGGHSISEMQAQYEVQKSRLEREKKLLEQEKSRLLKELATLSKGQEKLATERDVLLADKQKLAEKQVVLEQEKELIEEEIAKKQQEIRAMSAEKARALYLAERRSRLIDSLQSRKELDSLAIQQKDLALQNIKLESQRGRYWVYFLGSTSIVMLLVALLLYLRYLSKKKSTEMLARHNKIIEEERKRSDALLYNIMPAKVAKELKEKGSAKAQLFPEVTVMFSDFKNFTRLAELLTPAELVRELNYHFRTFDQIISQYPNVEKIKTIGDAYLCVCGLVKGKTVPQNIIRSALEFQDFLQKKKAEKERRGEPVFEARIGIHTGPVVAGVLGLKKYAYDIWGDTVNIAARMEQQCEPGRVNISETTYRLVKNDFDCQPRGRVPVKNKGTMEMYYVNGPR